MQASNYNTNDSSYISLAGLQESVLRVILRSLSTRYELAQVPIPREKASQVGGFLPRHHLPGRILFREGVQRMPTVSKQVEACSTLSSQELNSLVKVVLLFRGSKPNAVVD